MRSAAAAVAWEFRRRHRWGLIGVVAYLLVIGTIKLLMLRSGRQITLDDVLSFTLVFLVPANAAFLYFFAVFTFGLYGDIAARQSMYPVRMFTLPVTTAA